jgi:choline dehydrogenase
MSLPEFPQFDYIVVGAGSAGCMLANRLSADSSKRVLLIEAGGKDNYHWIHIPVGYLYCIGNPRTDWMYKTEPDAGLNGRSLLYPRGKVLGGCSSINGMIYMRGQARDYDTWAQLSGSAEWGWERVLPDFMAHEDFHGGASALHGSGGEWRVEKQRLHWDVLDAFSRAAVQAGIPESADFNSGSNEGVGYFEVNQKSGVRWNTSKAFLQPVRHRRNLSVWIGSQVAKLLLEDKRCVGVQLVRGAERVEARASREVLLCAGAIGSVQILQLSGIGDAASLAKLGITPAHELAGVGQNLQDHLQIRAIYSVQNAVTLNTLSASLWGKAKIALEYAFKRSGPMSMAPSQLGAFTRSSPAYAHPNIEFHVQPLSLDAFGKPLHPYPAITASVCNLNPKSTGSVRIRSANFADAPIIAPNYLQHAEDRQVAADSLRVVRKILAQDALKPYAPKELKPGLEFQSDEALAKLAGDIGTTIFHPVGTAKMGPASDPAAVVDAELRVHGIAGLRVVDASIMPVITSGNTNSPTLMIAEKAARWIIRSAA